ncbi:hypothetical protein C8J36_11398 [Rhizobium sp. PP-F2F-G48]|nr:hypothetical protein C8J36_11398 [Rhizobium sp. PP-F2F-G48]
MGHQRCFSYPPSAALSWTLPGSVGAACIGAKCREPSRTGLVKRRTSPPGRVSGRCRENCGLAQPQPIRLSSLRPRRRAEGRGNGRSRSVSYLRPPPAMPRSRAC